MSTNVIQLPGAALPKPEPKFAFREVKTYVANIQCPKCDQGYMVAVPMDQMLVTARTLQMNSPNYNLCEHKCTQCSHSEFYADRFPALRYFELGEEPV